MAVDFNSKSQVSHQVLHQGLHLSCMALGFTRSVIETCIGWGCDVMWCDSSHTSVLTPETITHITFSHQTIDHQTQIFCVTAKANSSKRLIFQIPLQQPSFFLMISLKEHRDTPSPTRFLYDDFFERAQSKRGSVSMWHSKSWIWVKNKKSIPKAKYMYVKFTNHGQKMCCRLVSVTYRYRIATCPMNLKCSLIQN